MSFICEQCSNVQPCGSKPKKIVIQKKEKIYPIRMYEKTIIDNGGKGWEIVKEIKVCEDCFKQK